MAASSSSVRQSGFSTKTGFPASSACTTSAACESCRVAMTTASTDASRMTADDSVEASEKPNFRPACIAATPEADATVTSLAPARLNAGISTPAAWFPAPINATAGSPVDGRGGCSIGSVACDERRAASVFTWGDGYSMMMPSDGSLPATTSYAASARSSGQRWETSGATLRRRSAMRSRMASKFRCSVHRTWPTG